MSSRSATAVSSVSASTGRRSAPRCRFRASGVRRARGVRPTGCWQSQSCGSVRGSRDPSLADPDGPAGRGESSTRRSAFDASAERFRADDNQSLLPVRPHPGQDHPESSIRFPNPGPPAPAAEHRELLTEREVLERQIRPDSRGQEKGEEPQEGRDHGWKCHVRSAESQRNQRGPHLARHRCAFPRSVSCSDASPGTS